MVLIPGHYYDQLADNFTDFSDEFYDALLATLTTQSFDPRDAVVTKKVREAMPIFVNRLREPTHTIVQTLKIAEDVAKQIGFIEMQASKPDSDTRLIMEATLVVILYIGIKKGIFHRPSVRLFKDFDDLQTVYNSTVPGFEDRSTITDTERAKLVYCANFMKTILLLIPNPKWKRAHLISIVTRLSEGTSLECFDMKCLCFGITLIPSLLTSRNE